VEHIRYNVALILLTARFVTFFSIIVIKFMNLKKNVAYSSRTADKFVVRLPEGMRDRIAEVARTQHRSMNSEIIARLESSLQQEGILTESDHDNLRLDSPEISHHERELLQHFRLLAHRQQNALLALITHDIQDEN